MQKSITFKKNNHTKTQRKKVKSEKGFTLLELIFVLVITGILSSTLILPFTSSITRGTQPEIYNTATYLAVDEMEWKRSDGYTDISAAIDAATNPLTVVTNRNVGNPITRTYTVTVVSDYVSHDTVNNRFNFSAVSTEFIRVTVTVSNPGIANVIMSEILARDIYNKDANL